MQFHHFGYVSGDPRIQTAAGVGIHRPTDLPEEVDVLIVGAGPAGMITAAQLSQFPNVTTRIIERRNGRLEVGQADGIQARSVETFQAFGFADRIIDEAYRITMMAFWKPDPGDPSRIIRTATPADDPSGVSEFPHLLVNQARVQDYFAEFMANAPTRMTPDYGYEYLSLTVTGDADHPVSVTVRAGDAAEANERIIRARYVVGCDGAKSAVRESIGLRLEGDQALHAWGVMDVLAVTDFPDIRMKCAIQSHDGGNILLIPREGGHLFRMYVDLGEVSVADRGAVRATTIDQIIAKANQILFPYTLDVKSVAWHSVYEVGHRLTERFDDRKVDGADTTPRVFIAGDACHTHSAKAGQGMNVSMQDGFNLGWKLGHVLDGRSPATLLDTYSAERHVIAANLIAFDKQWSTLMATRPEERDDPSELEDFYVKTFEFPAGFMTQYQPSMVTAEAAHQGLATGFPIGKRFRSAPVVRVCDANTVQLGHLATADGRWRIYVFADKAAFRAPSKLSNFASWISSDPSSPIVGYSPSDLDPRAWFDIKVILQQARAEVELVRVPDAFLPHTGPFGLIDYNEVFSADPNNDIFELRGVDRGGVVVVVRPDQYVSAVVPLAATAELAAFFGSVLLPSAGSRRS